jgi:hypothetical protein
MDQSWTIRDKSKALYNSQGINQDYVQHKPTLSNQKNKRKKEKEKLRNQAGL